MYIKVHFTLVAALVGVALLSVCDFAFYELSFCLVSRMVCTVLPLLPLPLLTPTTLFRLRAFATCVTYGSSIKNARVCV